ncbi:MAG: stage III sporulation AC/AD family protein [Lachnospiraceae bacterium]
MGMVKVGVVGLIGVLLAIQFRSHKPEYSYLIGFCICLFIFVMSLTYIENLLRQIQGLKHIFENNSSYINIIAKVVGITYICEFCAGICKDSGYAAIANQIELFGKISILISGMPILLSLITTLQKLTV